MVEFKLKKLLECVKTAKFLRANSNGKKCKNVSDTVCIPFSGSNSLQQKPLYGVRHSSYSNNQSFDCLRLTTKRSN